MLSPALPALLSRGPGRHQQTWLWTTVALGASLGIYFISIAANRKKGEGNQVESGDVNASSKSENTTANTVTPKQALQLISQRRSIYPKQYSSQCAVPRAVLEDMLEAARWAPSHRLTQPWHFIVFETLEQRARLGSFLANQYRDSTTSLANNKKKEFSQRKFAKKITNAAKASYVLALCVETGNNSNTKNSVLEDVCSVACAVQNMHLVASAHRVAAHWSSSAVLSSSSFDDCDDDGNDGSAYKTPRAVLEFLNLPVDDFLCLGWMFVGGYDDEWPSSKRRPCSYQVFGAGDSI